MIRKGKEILFLNSIKLKNSFGPLIYYYFQNKSIFLYYSDFNSNWGDAVNKFFIESIAGRKVISSKRVYNLLGRHEITGIGSILSSDLSNKIIWGSGFIKPPSTYIQPPIKILALRGKLSGKLLESSGIEDPGIYGDPALLFPEVYLPRIHKKYSIGIIPHYTELKRFKENQDFINSKDIKIISPLVSNSNFLEMVNLINECEIIFSSSLHGLILADAYKIPSLRFSFKDNSIIGGDFKFEDYYSGVGIESHDKFVMGSISDFSKQEIYRRANLKNIDFNASLLKNSLLNFIDEK